MTRHAVAKGPGPFLFRMPLALLAPARPLPPSCPFVAAVAATAAMSSTSNPLSWREHFGLDAIGRGGGERDEGEAGPARGGARTGPTEAAILGEGRVAPGSLVPRLASVAPAILDEGNPASGELPVTTPGAILE